MRPRSPLRAVAFTARHSRAASPLALAPVLTASTGPMLQLPCWVIIGPPGSGKGTYAKLLAKRFNLDHFSTGDLARELLKEPHFRAMMNAGQLLPDHAIIPLLLERLREVPASASGVLLDGFPRTIGQAKLFEKVLRVSIALDIQLKDEHIMAKTAGRRACNSCGAGYNVADVCDHENGVFMPPILPVAAAAMAAKASAAGGSLDDAKLQCDCGGLLSARTDDRPEVVADRLVAHHQGFSPILQYYKERGLLLQHRVHYGVKDMDGLELQIREHLGAGSSAPLALSKF